MVLRLKTRESRSLPGLQNATNLLIMKTNGPWPIPRAAPQGGFCRSKGTCRVSEMQGNTHNGASLKGDKSPSAICSGSKRKTPKAIYAIVTKPNGFCTNRISRAAAYLDGAGWSSPVARQAHNLKAAGSNPAPATNDTCKFSHSGNRRKSSSA